jgi:hypothetical protein
MVFNSSAAFSLEITVLKYRRCIQYVMTNYVYIMAMLMFCQHHRKCVEICLLRVDIQNYRHYTDFLLE